MYSHAKRPEKKDSLNVPRLLRALLVIGVIAALAAIAPRQTVNARKPSPNGYGVSIAYGLGGAQELNELRTAWYTDYDYRGAALADQQRLYMVKTSWDPAGVADVARSHPGEWWQFGNEPNDLHQDNVSPSEYAHRYRSFYHMLKDADPSAQVIPAGLANADWRWAESFRQAYEREYGTWPPVDGWNIHNYLLDSCASATDVNLFKSRIESFRSWMARNGEADKPLFLTEYGVLYGNGCCNCPTIPPDQVAEFMQMTSQWLSESHAANAWAWFAVRTDGRTNGDLFFPDRVLTEFGRAYRDLVHASVGRK